jgi:VanZ family protein
LAEINQKVLLSFLPAVSWAILLLVLSLMPTSGILDFSLPQIPHIDKIAHLVMYAMMGLLLSLGFSTLFPEQKKRIVLYPAILASTYGLIMEILQFHTSYRSFEWGDIAANTLGAILGAISFVVFLHRPR